MFKLVNGKLEWTAKNICSWNPDEDGGAGGGGGGDAEPPADSGDGGGDDALAFPLHDSAGSVTDPDPEEKGKAADNNGGEQSEAEQKAAAQKMENFLKQYRNEDGELDADKLSTDAYKMRQTIGEAGNLTKAPKEYSLAKDSPVAEIIKGTELEGDKLWEQPYVKEMMEYARANGWSNKHFNDWLVKEAEDFKSEAQVLQGEAETLRKTWGDDFDKNAERVQVFVNNAVERFPDKKALIAGVVKVAQGNELLLMMADIMKSSGSLPAVDGGASAALEADILSEEKLAEVNDIMMSPTSTTEQKAAATKKWDAHIKALEAKTARR